MRDEDSQKRFSPLSITIALILFVAIGAAAAYGIQMMSAKAPVDLVVLKADQGDFKTKAEAVNIDKSAEGNSTVFNLLDELSSAKEDVEVLNLEPSSPELPELKIDEPQNEEPQNEEPQNEVPQNEDAIAQTEAKQDADPSSSTTGEATDSTETAVAEDQPAAPTKRPAAPRVVKKNIVKDGPSMMVQLAAFRNQAKAQEIASLLTEKHADRLQGLTLGVMQIDTGSSGIFWRVITEALPNEDARALCDSLKRAGQDCILRKANIQ